MTVTLGQIVSFGGDNFQALQAEASAAPNWQPPNVPALWKELGPCSGSGATPTPSATPRGTATPTATVAATPSGTPIGNPTTRRLLAGYWQDFSNGNGVVTLGNASANYDIYVVAFANASGASISFSVDPSVETEAQFIADVQAQHSRGKKVIMSIGGATETITLNSSSDVSTFVSSVTSAVTQFGFDGIDIDFENASLQLNAGDTNINSPSTPQVQNLITALHDLHNNFGSGFIETIAPETFFAQLAFQFYGPGPFNGQDPRAGAQLAVINNCRDVLTYVWTQDYNSGPIEALDGNSYSSGVADFPVSMTEMLLKGFPVANNAGNFAPLPAEMVMIGIPANQQAAGSGFLSNPQLIADFNYLIGGPSDGGSYKLQNPAGYPNLRGIMTWSTNWDNFGGNVFGDGMRSYLDSLPPVQ